MKLLAQNFFYLPCIAPATTPATQYTPGINMGKCEAVAFICDVGALSTADYTITVGCSATAKSTAYDIDLGFYYSKSATAGTDTMGALTYVAGSGTSSPGTGINWANGTDSGMIIVIHVSSAMLTQGYPYLQLTITKAGSATAVGMSVNAIVEPRYPQLTSKDGSGTSFFV